MTLLIINIVSSTALNIKKRGIKMIEVKKKLSHINFHKNINNKTPVISAIVTKNMSSRAASPVFSKNSPPSKRNPSR